MTPEPNVLEPSEPVRKKLKILILGLCRTGTQSISDALELLGIGPIYHMRHSAAEDHRSQWRKAFGSKLSGEGTPLGRADFDELFSKYEGVADIPASVFYSELLHTYPDIPVILSVRPVEKWYDSMLDTVCHLYQAREREGAVQRHSWSPLMHEYLWKEDFERFGREAYGAHNEGVRRAAKDMGREILEFDVGVDGWSALCGFLGVDVAGDVDAFPRRDDWKEYKEQVAKERKGNELVQKLTAAFVLS